MLLILLQSKLIRLKSVFFDLLFLSLELFLQRLDFPVSPLIGLLQILFLIIEFGHLGLDLTHLLLRPVLLLVQLQLMIQLMYLVLHPLYDRLHVIERGGPPAAAAAPCAGVVLGRGTREGVTEDLDVPLQPVDVGLLLPYLVFLLVNLAL